MIYFLKNYSCVVHLSQIVLMERYLMNRQKKRDRERQIKKIASTLARIKMKKHPSAVDVNLYERLVKKGDELRNETC